MRYLVQGLVLAGLLAAPAAAAVTTYECTFPQERARGGGWIPEVVAIADDPAKGTVSVYDPIIRHFAGAPIPAERSEETRARIGFRWQLSTRNKGQAAVMLYRLTYFKDGRPAKMLVQPGGYDNQWSGEGTCRIRTR